MSPLAAVLLLAAAVANPVAAELRSTVTPDGVIRLWPGEKIVVRAAEGQPPVLVSAAAVAETEAAPPKPGQGAFADPPAGALVLLLGREGERLHFKLESGVAKAFDYQAHLVAGATKRPVKACTALPLLANYELWLAAGADAVEISNLSFRDTNEVLCSGPDGAK